MSFAGALCVSEGDAEYLQKIVVEDSEAVEHCEAGRLLDEEGNVTNPSVPEEMGERESEDDGEVDATDAARRKAGELDVNLSRVRGTGSGGRVLVKDVERAAKQPAADST